MSDRNSKVRDRICILSTNSYRKVKVWVALPIPQYTTSLSYPNIRVCGSGLMGFASSPPLPARVAPGALGPGPGYWAVGWWSIGYRGRWGSKSNLLGYRAVGYWCIGSVGYYEQKSKGPPRSIEMLRGFGTSLELLELAKSGAPWLDFGVDPDALAGGALLFLFHTTHPVQKKIGYHVGVSLRIFV